MQYINTETGAYPLDLEIIQQHFRNMSLPPGDFEPPAPFAKVLETTKPECDRRIQQVVPGAAVLIDGVYYQGWDTLEIFATQEEKDASIAAHLKMLKDRKIKSINDERARLKTNGVLVDGKWFQTDAASRTVWAAMLSSEFPTTQWLTMDDTAVATSAELAMLVFQATAQLDVALANHAQYLILGVEVSEDPSLVDITVGWPATFSAA